MAPLTVAEMDAETRESVERAGFGGKPLNIFATLAHHPKLLKRWLVFGSHVLTKSTLDARERELLILRTGWRCGSAYEWAQHVAIGRAAGITDDDIARLTEVPASSAWSERDALLVRCADELFDDRTLSEATYAALTAHYSDEQVLDILFAVGQYQLVSTVLRSLGVQRDDGVADAPMPSPL
ncbi:MAG TPA: carboxymuconolactone decarboxylase family protein [Acidimicrobiia bacterium]|jgi:alkylhydroperoxidase family enzyme